MKFVIRLFTVVFEIVWDGRSVVVVVVAVVLKEDE